MVVTDFRIIDDDLIFKDGDFQISSSFEAEADVQHIFDLLRYNKGELKQYPFIGAGIERYQNAPKTDILKLNTIINDTLVYDKYRVLSIGGGDGIVSVDLDTAIINVNAERI